jgi:hypothetical protein
LANITESASRDATWVGRNAQGNSVHIFTCFAKDWIEIAGFVPSLSRTGWRCPSSSESFLFRADTWCPVRSWTLKRTTGREKDVQENAVSSEFSTSESNHGREVDQIRSVIGVSPWPATAEPLLEPKRFSSHRHGTKAPKNLLSPTQEESQPGPGNGPEHFERRCLSETPRWAMRCGALAIW